MTWKERPCRTRLLSVILEGVCERVGLELE